MAAKRGPKGPLTDAHKAALAAGRAEGKVVRDYLEALRANKPRRGRKRTPDSIHKRLDKIDAQLTNADAVAELKLVQERLDLTRELEASGSQVDLSALETAFVETAARYGARNGISYSAWRQVGVEPAVLKRAGIGRGA